MEGTASPATAEHGHSLGGDLLFIDHLTIWQLGAELFLSGLRRAEQLFVQRGHVAVETTDVPTERKSQVKKPLAHEACLGLSANH